MADSKSSICSEGIVQPPAGAASALICDPNLPQWCIGMASRILPTNDPHPGLSPLETVSVSIETLKIVTRGVRFRAYRGDCGILLNFCPWCGAPLREDGPQKPFAFSANPTPVPSLKSADNGIAVGGGRT